MITSCYQGKRILVTGHTGFKGCWLAHWLTGLGAEVFGYALEAEEGSLHSRIGLELSGDFRGDICDRGSVAEVVAEIEPDFVFHLAAQPLVLRSYEAPLETLMTNVMGVANVLEAVRNVANTCHTVIVTSDKCYRNCEWEYAYREVDALGGHDVYSASKAAAEIVTAAWQKSFFHQPGGSHVATARGGNVIGGGDFSADRIVPDCMRALSAGEPVSVRSPKATRPWQHVLDCLSGYLRLGEWLASAAPSEFPNLRAFNFGPSQESQRSVAELVEEILKSWPGSWVDASDPRARHEAGRLSVSIERASSVLGWRPSWTFEETVRHTTDFYRACFEAAGTGGDLKELMNSQINLFSQQANLVWK